MRPLTSRLPLALSAPVLAVVLVACGTTGGSGDEAATEPELAAEADAASADAGGGTGDTPSEERGVDHTASIEPEPEPEPDVASEQEPEPESEPVVEGEADLVADAPAAEGEPPESDYLASYELVDEEFGTMVSVTVEDGARTIETNSLPDHETGEFPNAGNPNGIAAQDLTYEFPSVGTYTGTATYAQTPGVAVNGVAFEPGTAETVTCASGETARIEALQDVYDLGLDVNNAHVQPGGQYHYHGVSGLLVDAYADDDDLVHVGFAADGFLVYYSESGAYTTSYALLDEDRTGTECVASGPDSSSFDLAGTTPDGTYTSDYAYVEGSGDLDECNGVEIDGEYVYLITDEYPYVGRCLMGEFTRTGPGAGGPPPGGSPPGGQAP